MTLEYENPSPQFIIANNKVEEITLHDDGDWYDPYGTVLALATKDYAAPDADNRCGVGVFSLPADNSLNDSCKPHDYMYSSPSFQSFHTRQYADYYLKSLLELAPNEKHSVTPSLFEVLARQEGFHFWDNPETNN